MRAFGKLIETLIEIGKIIDSKPFTQSDEEPYVCHLQMSFTILLLILIYDPVTHHYARTSRPKVFCKKKVSLQILQNLQENTCVANVFNPS